MKQGPVPSRVLWPLGLAVCLSLFGDLTLYAVLVTEMDGIGLSLGAVGIMLSVNRLVRIPGNPLAGALVDRMGRRYLFISGMLLGVFSTAGYGFLRGFWPFLAARLAWGIAWTLIYVGGMAMVVDVSSRADRGRWMGAFNTWMLAGLALGPVAGGFLVDRFGFRGGMLACAAITAVGLAVAFLALPETSEGVENKGRRRESAGERGGRAEAWSRRVVGLLRANPGLVTASVLYLIIQFTGEGVVFSTATLLLQQRLGESVAFGDLTLGVALAGGLVLGLRSLVAGAVGPLAGHLSDTGLGRWKVVAGSVVAGSIGFGLLAYVTSPWLILLAVALGAVSAGAALAVLAALVGDLAPPGSQGLVIGAYATAGDLGSMAGPFLAFALLPVLGLQSIYLFCSVLLLAGVGLIWRTRSGAELARGSLQG